jgi:hypothetical protein
MRMQGRAQWWSGFHANDGEQLVAQGRLLSNRNKEHGFAAEGKGSLLATWDNCSAQANKDCNFTAADGGQLLVGRGCTNDLLDGRDTRADAEGSYLAVRPEPGAGEDSTTGSDAIN